jgi:hypothetical protein
MIMGAWKAESKVDCARKLPRPITAPGWDFLRKKSRPDSGLLYDG